MFKIYQWRNEPIENIEKWAFDRGEKMVDIIWTIKSVNPFAKKAKNMILYTEEKDTMPQSFFNTLQLPPNHFVKSTKLRDPIIN